MSVAEAPRRSRARVAENIGLHQHRDNSSGGRINIRDIEGVTEAGSALTDHHLLLNLTTYDDHTQYLYLAGRAGGQTAYGDTAAAGNFTLSSTAHATKGKLLFGSSSAYDEASVLLGIGITSPTAGLHVVANPQPATLIPSSDIDTLSTDPTHPTDHWGRYGAGGGASPNPTTWQNLTSDDTDTSMIAQSDGVGTYHDQIGMGGSIAPAASITVHLKAEILFGATLTAGRGSLTVRVFDSAGTSYGAVAVDPSTYNNTWTDRSFVCTPDGGGASTANSVRITYAVSPVGSATGGYLGITYAYVAGSSAAGAVARFKTSASTTLNNTEWLDSTNALMAHIDALGGAQFQNVAIEDAGAGTGTITLKAPVGVTSWTLTFPADDGNANDVLTSNGSGVTSWTALAASTFPHVVLDSTVHTDTLTHTVARGDLIVGNSTPKWAALALGTSGQYLSSGATDVAWTTGSALSRTDDTNVTLTLGGSATTALLAAASITVGWTGTLAIARGGTGQATATLGFNALSPLTTLGDLLYHDGTNNVRLAGQTTTTRKFLRQTGAAGPVSAAPAWDTILAADVPASALTKTDDTNVTLTLGGAPTTALLAATSLTLGWTGTLGVSRGGTNLASGTSGGILGYTAAGVLASSVLLTASALVLGGGAGATPTPMGSLGTTTTVLHGNAAGAPTFGAVSLTADVTGTLPVANGGTGQTTALAAFNGLSPLTTRGDLLTRDASNNVRLAVGTSGKFLRSDGTDPSWQLLVAGDIPDLSATYQPLDADLTQIAAVANVRGDILVTDSGPTWVRLATGATGTVLHGGTDPAYSAVSLTADVAGTLPVANGGTSLATLTAHALYVGNGTSAPTALAVGATSQILTGSTGADPGWTTVAAGILTFLGTPSSANLATAVTDETGSGALVFGTSPTIVTPTIANFTNATHNHTNAAGGGQLTAAAFSAFSMADNVFRITGSADATKILAFEVDGLSVGTRTLTPQNADYTIAGTNIANNFTSAQTFSSSILAIPTTDVVVLTIGPTQSLGIGGSSRDIIQVVDDSGAPLLTIDNLGGIDNSGSQSLSMLPGQRVRNANPSTNFCDFTDASKQLYFDLTGATAACHTCLTFHQTAVRTVSFPDGDYTLAGLSLAQTWTALQTFKDTTFKVVDDGDSSKTLVFSLGGATANADLTIVSSQTADHAITIPDGTTTLAGLGLTQTITGPWTHSSGSFTAGAGGSDEVVPLFKASLETIEFGNDSPALAISDGSAFKAFICPNRTALTANRYFQLPTTSSASVVLIGTNDTNSVSNKTYVNARFSGGSTTNYITFGTSATTGARTVNWSDETSRAVVVGNTAVASGANATARSPGKVDSGSVGADFTAAQIVTTGSVGLWRLDSYLECTVAGAGSGTMTTTWGWTDSTTARTDATQTQALTTTVITAASSFSRIVYVGSGHITIQCLIAGAYLLGAKYRLTARATFLG